MKKIFTALAALALVASASATTLVTEYNYHAIQGNPGGYTHNQYVAVGVVQPIGKFGVVDAYLQGAGATSGAGTDRQGGWEAGYSYPLAVGGFTLTPRLATGAMNRIYGGPGVRLDARYWLASAELSKPLTQKLGGYVSVSHMNGINADSIARANRVQVGVDYAVAKNIGARVGYSYQVFGAENMSGVVLIGSYSF